MRIGHTLSGAAFTAFQRDTERHVSFSLTRACPLSCAHCSVDTVPVGAHTSNSMAIDDAERYAGELADLARRGVRHVSFTGGEPLLALEQLDVLSTAARAAGMTSTVVTACHWAPTAAAATRVVERFDAIDCWHLSTDRYHLEWVPLANVVAAAGAVVAAGRRAQIRLAVPLPLDDDDRRLHAELVEQVPDDVEIVAQRVVAAGRATRLEIRQPAGRRAVPPCTSTGLLVGPDGAVSPCCSGITDSTDPHPFRYPNASTAGLATTHARWQSDTALQLIRTVGFAPILDWIADEDPEHPALRSSAEHPCDLCVALWRRPTASAIVTRRCRTGAVVERVRQLRQILYESQEPTDEGTH